MKKTNLIVDLSNIVHARHHTLLKKNNKIFNKNLLIFRSIQAIIQTAKKFKVDGVMIACDSKNCWRYDIYPEYKGNREDLKDPYYKEVKQAISDISSFFTEYTAIPSVSSERAEADDIIASVAQNTEHKLIILSSDTDFVQLLDNDGVTLFSPSQQVERTSTDPKFDLFVKCIRGDRGDNISSAFPRVRVTRLEKAWTDKYEMINIMESSVGDKKVKDLYKFNQRLIDLTRQPAYIKRDIENNINSMKINKYNDIGILRFIGDHELKNFTKDFMMFKDIFNKHFILNEGVEYNARSDDKREKETLLYSKARRSK